MIVPEVGAVIGGLRIDGVAGRGGMGVVYRAHQLALDRAVALKIVNPDLAGDAEFRERFRREARLAAALDHPHVVPIFHAGEDDGHLYLTMRLVDGVDLAALIRERGRLAPRDACAIVAQVAGALDAAHARGLVHRDVKPANVLVTGDPGRRHAYLTDFGISKEIQGSSITQSGLVVGSMDYISPEALEGGAVDGRTDVYSLGCVLFQALTGRVPFPRDSTAARMYAHLHAPAPPTSSAGPGLGPALDAVLARAMAKRPADRFATAGEFARAALGAASGAPAAPPPGPFPPPPWTGPSPSGPASQPRKPGTGTGVRGRRGLLVGGAVAAVAVVVAAALVVPTLSTGNGSAPPTVAPTTTTAPAVPTVAAGTVVGEPVKVGAGPIDLVGGDGYVWTANTSDKSISRIDPTTRAVVTTRVDGQPTELVVGKGTAWVWNYSSAITPVDVATGRVGELIRIEFELSSIVADDTSVWFAVPDRNAVGRIDMATATFDGNLIDLGRRPDRLAVGGGKLYALSSTDHSITTVDTATRKVEGDPRPVPDGITSVGYADDGSLYIVGTAGYGVLGAGTPQLVEPEGAAGITVGGGSAWIVDDERNEIRRVALDLRTPVAAPLAGFGRGVGDVEVIDGVLWYASRTDGTVSRIDPTPL